MINAISIALSGLNSASTRLNASASNIANTLTENYTPLDTTSKTGQNGSIETRIIDRPAPFENNLTEEIIDIKVAELAYKANIQTINVTDNLFEELINIFDDE